MKTCKKCGEIKELDLFAKGAKYTDGRRNTCKKCHSNYMTQYYKDNPEKIHFSRTAPKQNWRRHRITEDYFNSMISLFDGKCHSCKTNTAVNIDHDHNCCEASRSCGKCVRGVLCHHCNSALGLLKDDKEKILNLLKYVDSF